jgi:glycosyltransferase involved in cell wall biosynthesis
VFFLSSLWKKEKTTNQYRANFIHACRDIRSLTFEGGFAPRRYKDIDGFEDYTIDRRYEFKEYLRQLKKSIVAFNTPAVESCHGWKLGEYLALGKAIISTPLKRLLPVPLAHGENIHFVDGSIMQIKDALLTIKNDNVYRHKIECNAKKYFLHYLAPRKCIERIINLLHISI